MPIYLFVWHLLAWSVTVVILLPLTIPWSVLAYKIWHGFGEIDEEMGEEIWSRAWRVNLLLLLTGPIFIALDFVAADWFELPAGPIHIVFLLCFVAFVSWRLMHYFSLEDFFQGLILATIYLYLPVTLMFLISLLFTNPLQAYLLSWLIQPTER